MTTDPIRGAVRSAQVKLEIDGKAVTLHSGNYELPRTVGPVQVDCPVVSAYRKNTTEDHWALEKARAAAGLAGGVALDRARRHSSIPSASSGSRALTQMANEPIYVDGGEDPQVKSIYYHAASTSAGPRG